MAGWNSRRTGLHAAGEFHECNHGAGKCDATDQDAQVGGYHVQGGDVADIRQHASDAGEDGRKSDDRVQGCDSLGKSGGCNAAAEHGAYNVSTAHS